MSRYTKIIPGLFGMLFLISFLSTVAACQDQPIEVTVCQLKADPPSFNHNLVQVTGFVSHDFEDFTIFDPTCPAWPGVWLEYGGKKKSGTMYCCGVTADRSRWKKLKIEGIPIPLRDDERFREFDKRIQPPFRSGRYGAVVHATLVGRFFSGTQIKYPKETIWGGYGHMGCCSLLAIQEVNSVHTQDRNDLDYGASADQPDIEETGCGYRTLTPLEPTDHLIAVQKKADDGQPTWAFDDPRRLAIDALSRLANVQQEAVAQLKEKRRAQGRYVYEWTPAGSAESYMVVVSRPYLLSFYARDPKRVAWVVTAIYLSSCGYRNNSVTRIE
jgi:hypothetical protein